MVLASILVFWAYGRGCPSARGINSSGIVLSGSERSPRWYFRPPLHGLLSRPLQSDPGSFHPEGGRRDQLDLSNGHGLYLLSSLAFYVAGLLCWSYTVIRLVTMGRVAGYGLALMFIAGYALLFSSLTLMVILGVMLLTLDRPKRHGDGRR